MPSRRQLLTTTGSMLAGGCLATPNGPETEVPEGTERTDEPGPTPPTTDPSSGVPVELKPGDSFDVDDWTIRVDNVHVRHGVATFGIAHVDPLWVAGSQFVVADVSVSGNGPSPHDIDVAVETETVDGRSDRVVVLADSNTDRRTRFGFPVPIESAPPDAAIVLRGERHLRWVLSDTIVRHLGRSPSFSVRSFDVPGQAAPEATIDVSVTVQNDGERDGRFLAELGTTALSDQPEVTATVLAGESVRFERSVRLPPNDRNGVEVVLRWADGLERRSVSLQR